MEKIYEEEFYERVIKAPHPVVVDFYADWCGPCKMLSPVLGELESEFDDFEFLKINVDENRDLVMKYNISSIPNVVVFKNGEPAASSLGFKGYDGMKEFLESV